jgi:D-3-phosphoglycerate dehydrogenase
MDVKAATAHGIWATNRPGCTDEVATHTIALILLQARRLPQARQLVRQGEWDPRHIRPMPHVRKQTLGIIAGADWLAVTPKVLVSPYCQ